MLGFYAAITRQDPTGQPAGGWMPDERLSRDEMLKSFTWNAAYAAHAEKDLGSLEVGKLADLVVARQERDDRRAEGDPDDAALLTRSSAVRSCTRSQANGLPLVVGAMSCCPGVGRRAAQRSRHAPVPQLLVIVVVDQMRFDYLDRYAAFWTRGAEAAA